MTTEKPNFVERNLDEATAEVFALLAEQRRRTGTFLISQKALRKQIQDRFGGSPTQAGYLARGVMKRLQERGIAEIWDQEKMSSFKKKIYKVHAEV